MKDEGGDSKCVSELNTQTERCCPVFFSAGYVLHNYDNNINNNDNNYSFCSLPPNWST